MKYNISFLPFLGILDLNPLAISRAVQSGSCSYEERGDLDPRPSGPNKNVTDYSQDAKGDEGKSIHPFRPFGFINRAVEDRIDEEHSRREEKREDHQKQTDKDLGSIGHVRIPPLKIDQ